MATDDDAESRVDYLADMLGMTKESVINAVNLMRQEGILADSQDMSAYIEHSENKSKQVFEQFVKLEQFLLTTMAKEETAFSYKALNEKASENGIRTSIKNIKTLLYFLSVNSYIKKRENVRNDMVQVVLCHDLDQTLRKHERRIDICRFIIERLHALALEKPLSPESSGTLVQFSVTSLLKEYDNLQKTNLFQKAEMFIIEDIEDAFLTH